MINSAEQLVSELRARARSLRAEAMKLQQSVEGAGFLASSAHFNVAVQADGKLKSIKFAAEFATASAATLSNELLELVHGVQAAVADPNILASGRIGKISLTQPVPADFAGTKLPSQGLTAGGRRGPDRSQVQLVADLPRTGTGALRSLLDPAVFSGDYEEIARNQTEQKIERLLTTKKSASKIIGAGSNDYVALKIGDDHQLTSVLFSMSILRLVPAKAAEAFAAAYTSALGDYTTQIKELMNQ